MPPFEKNIKSKSSKTSFLELDSHFSGSGDSAATSPDTSSDSEMDRVEVYLRLKPLEAHEESVVEIENEQSIVVNPHAAAQLTGQR